MPVSKIKPPLLKPGDEVAIVSPAFAIDEPAVESSVSILESWGLKVRQGRHILKRDGPFAGTDRQRLSDLQKATSDTRIKAVFCSRGGYGLIRIIDKVDFSALRRHPRWYVGYSDVTVLHAWLSERYGIISLHGEMPLNYSNPSKKPESLETLRKALFEGCGAVEWEGPTMRKRSVAGEITGGNLSLLYSLAGTPGEPQTDGKILFIEEVGEYYYHLDRMLSSLKLAGKFRGLKALVVGGMNDMADSRVPWGRDTRETISDIFREYDYPVFFDFPAGHVPDNRAFYIGAMAEIQCSGKKSKLTF